VSAAEEREKTAAAVRELGALPMPGGPEPLPRTLDVVEEELTGVNLSLYEEELENARLRLALASAQRGRRELRARVAELEAERHSTNEALNEALSDAAEALRVDRGPTPEESADRLTRFFAPTQALREDKPASADRIVAYRDPSNHQTLLCREHGKHIAWVNPVTSADLPDGGFCTYGRMTGLECGKDVLIGGSESGGGA
jgi:hypothetical protein